MEILLFVLGVVVGWAIQHFYSARSSNEQRALFGKLSAELRDLVLADPREHLSVAELNQLIDERTIDPERTTDPLPYVACPKCGSKNIKKQDSIDPRGDDIYYTVGCLDCGWGDWTQ